MVGVERIANFDMIYFRLSKQLVKEFKFIFISKGNNRSLKVKH